MTTTVSCVIPVRNERHAIAAAVRSCLEQRYDGAIEVIVADGMSSDGTREVIAQLAAADPRVRMVDNPARVTPAALNAAIAASSGEVVVRCDAHAVLPPGYVATAVATLERTGAANVGGIQHAVGDDVTSRAIAMAMTSPIGVGDARFRRGGDARPVDTVYLGVFRRDAVDAVGGFDETLVRNQDYELNYRLRTSGGIVWFDPDLVVDYRPRGSLGSLWRQYLEYGKGKRVMLRLHPRSLRWRQLAPPLLVVGLGGSVAAAALGAGWVAAVVPVAYGLALTGGAVVELTRGGGVAALLIPAAVATMHVAWGGGFLMETARGLTRQGRGDGRAPQASA
jgi:glycosyltransferase involved in cell wall biosynthesis